MNTTKRNVILYCRVSSDEQKLNTSLSHQEETLSEHCRRQGYNIVNIYKDGSKELACIHHTQEGAETWVEKSKSLLLIMNENEVNPVVDIQIQNWLVQ